MHDAVDAFAKDFGYDLDEEGQPLDDDAPPAGRSDPQGESGDEGQIKRRARPRTSRRRSPRRPRAGSR